MAMLHGRTVLLFFERVTEIGARYRNAVFELCVAFSVMELDLISF